MLVLKALLQIGMEKVVPTNNNKHSRRHSTGNLAFEHADVLSRYLKEPSSSSCHETCKQLDSTITTPEKSNKTPPTSKRIFTPIPKRSSTKDVKITNTSLVKNQLKPLPSEPIRHDFLKSKSKIKSNDPFYIPPSTTHRRRYSEIVLPTGGLGLGDVLDSPAVAGLTKPKSSKKIDSKNNPISNSKPNSGNGNVSKKVQTQTLKTHSSLPKPVVDHGSRKSKAAKPVGETVPDQSDKTRSPTTSSERVVENGCNESQVSSTSKEDETLNDGCDESQGSSTSKLDETLRSHDRDTGCNEAQMSISKKDEALRNHDQSNGGGKKPETSRRIGKSVKEHGDNLPQKIKLKQGKIVDPISSGCNTPRKHKFKQHVSNEKDQIEDDNKVSLRRQESIKSMNVEKNKRQHSGLNNVIEETASKLIQTRKSRVKALVGAFEMISESKL